MPIINDMGTALLWLIRVGVVLRIIILLLKIMADTESKDTYGKRIKNILIFYILAESIYQIAAIVKKYFSGAPSGNIHEISQIIINLLT